MYNCGQSDVYSPADTMFDADGVWIDGWPLPTQKLPKNKEKPVDDCGMGRIGIDRHKGGINVTFVDGHAKFELLDRLSTLTYRADPRVPLKDRPADLVSCDGNIPKTYNCAGY
jgi:prepilin-type processing-associated H-X9-DG protein